MHSCFLRVCSVLMCGCLALLGKSIAQVTQPNSAPNPRFRASSRLVLVDVVVTNKRGEFVRDLKSADFTVLEDGRLQAIAGFTPHSSTEVITKNSHPPLPEHQFTNYNAPPPGHPITIVLLDMLNTVFEERPYARQQMIKFLGSLPAGQPVALFTMGGNLKMLHGFTQSSDALIAAAKALLDKNESARLNTSEEDLENAESMDAEFAAMMSIGGRAITVTKLAKALEVEQAYQLDVRVQTTLESLRMLAQAVAGYSGRKNLIWLSADFPVGLQSLLQSPSPQKENYDREIYEASAALSSGQIAVYPIDVRGLESEDMDVTLRSAPSGKQRARRIDTQWSTRSAMKDIADETGGEAFYNRNDLADAMRRSLDEGTNYYTLAYVPQNHEWNGSYRKIDVKVAVEGAKTRHRSGYYALPETRDADAADQLLVEAMQRTVPQSTRLLMKVQVLPPNGDRKSVSIDFAVVAADLDFADVPDQRKNAVVEFSAVALDKNWKPDGIASKTIDASMRPETYQRMLRAGFPGHLDLDVKPGKYMLRLGVMDRHNQRIGTLDVPLEVPAEGRPHPE
jgi:VWFA-related protein